MKKYEAYENILLAISGHLKDQEIISDSLKVIKQALTTPQISEEQMQQGFGSDAHKLFIKNKKYKQLLDKIEEHTLTLSSVCDNEFDNKHICAIQSILEQLKSIGGNNGSTL